MRDKYTYLDREVPTVKRPELGGGSHDEHNFLPLPGNKLIPILPSSRAFVIKRGSELSSVKSRLH